MARPPLKIQSTGARPPTNEIGAVSNIMGGVFSFGGMAPWTTFVDYEETVPELIWPRSVATYSKMRSDTQIAALYQATILGLRKMEWALDPNGADIAIVDKLSRDYNLPVTGNKPDTRLRGRMKHRFVFREHLRKAFYAGIYGHYYFEQVGYIGDGRFGRPDDGLWHLQKLAERPPRTIADFRIAQDGGLISIIQNTMGAGGQTSYSAMLPEIPVDRLVGYVWEHEGANWAGRSWFRECYKNWLIKDRLMRIDAVNHERAGGVPYIEAHPGATYDEIKALNEMAQGFRVGDVSGGAVPAGAKFNIARASSPSVVDSMKYHDEAMARKFMLMVMQLGQTRVGSRALGNTFVDFWGGGLEAIAWWFADTFNEHVIEDDVDWNWGEDVEQVPMLIFQIDPEMVVQDLTALISSGAIVVDDELEAALRKELGLPVKGTPRQPMTVQVQPPTAAAPTTPAGVPPTGKAPPGASGQPPKAQTGGGGNG